MSGFLAGLSAALADATSWRNNLRPASFRGVPFWVDIAAGSGGRRIVQHQFALRNDPAYEDLGQEANKYRITGFVVGDDYLAQSQDLLAALQDFDTAAIFVHPWRGEIRCRAGLISWHESKDLGGYCAFNIDFVVDIGGLPSPIAAVDTASQLLAGIASMLKLALSAYQEASLIIQHPSLLIGLAGGLLGTLVGPLLGLPASTIGGLVSAVAAVALTPGDDTATATAVQTVFQGAAAAVITAQTPPDDPSDPILGITPILAPGADLTGGLAGLATWADTLPLPSGAIQAQQQQAIQGLVQGQAVLAVLTIYAQIDWPSANAATAARAQVQAMLDAQMDLTAALGQDDLYRGWRAIGAQAMQDLITRAQALPALVPFQVLASQPSLVLAQMWYQDAGRGDELGALNDVPDPMFMPFAGVRLSA